jgi:glycogen operon protein
MQRNFLATLMLSRGVPMLLAGDEMGRTQRGNNNAYCQDNEISWVDWRLSGDQRRLLTFARSVSLLRRRLDVLKSCDFYKGRASCDCGLKDIAWLRPDGQEMTVGDWEDPAGRSLGMLLHDRCAPGGGGPVRPATLLVIYHSGADTVDFALPRVGTAGAWRCRLDTARPTGKCGRLLVGSVGVRAHSLVLCEHVM